MTENKTLRRSIFIKIFASEFPDKYSFWLGNDIVDFCMKLNIFLKVRAKLVGLFLHDESVKTKHLLLLKYYLVLVSAQRTENTMKLKFQMWEGNSIIFVNSSPKMFKVIFASKSGTEYALNNLFQFILLESCPVYLYRFGGVFEVSLLSLEKAE